MANTTINTNEFKLKEDLTPIQIKLIEFLQNGPASRKTLVKELETPRTTIYDNLKKLQKRKIIEKSRDNNGERGRPLVYWELKKGWLER